MPVPTPNTVREGNRNYVNLSGAILNPLAQSFGEMAGQGLKDMFDIHSASEDYQRSLIAANERALADKASADLKEEMLNPDFSNRWQDPEFQKNWAAVRFGGDEEKAQAFLDSTVADSPVARAIREGGANLDEWGKSDPRPRLPNLASGSTPGINPNEGGALTLTPPTSSTSQPVENAPAEAPVAEGLQTQQTVKQTIQQGAESIQSSPNSKAVPEVPGVAPLAPPSPQGVPGTTPTQGLEQPQPLDVAKFQDQAKAFMIRQQGRLGLYRQMVNAASTGKMDAEQASLGAALSGVHQSELTAMMETVAPSLGLPLKDNDGKPIQGNALLDAQAHAMLTRYPDALSKLPAAQQEAMRAASDRYKGLIGNMDASRAAKFQELADKFTKSNLASPEAMLTYANAEKARNDAMIRHKDSIALESRAADREDQRLGMALETQKIANEGQRIQLAITRKYAGPQAELQIQKAQLELKTDLERLRIVSTKEERDSITSLLSAVNSKAEADARRGVVWYNDNQRKQSAYLKQIATLNKNMADLEAKNAAILSPAYDNMKKLRDSMKDDSKIDSWISTQPPEFQQQYRGASPAEKFEQYYRAQDPAYAAYASQMDDWRRQIGNQEALFTATVEAQAPGINQDPLSNALQGYTQKLVDKQLAPLMKAEMKGLYKDASPDQWAQVLQENPTSINILLGKTLSRQPDDKGWDTQASMGLLRLVQGSLHAGHRFDAEAVANAPVAGGKRLRDVIGPARMGNYYNSYVQLMGELGDK